MPVLIPIPTVSAALAMERASVSCRASRGEGLSGEEAEGGHVVHGALAPRHGNEKPVLKECPPVVVQGVPYGESPEPEAVGGEVGNPLIVSGSGVGHDGVVVGASHMIAKARLMGEEVSVGLNLPVSTR